VKQWVTERAQVLEQQAPKIMSRLQNQLEHQPLFKQSFLDLFLKHQQAPHSIFAFP
jgi:hypothetical protein